MDSTTQAPITDADVAAAERGVRGDYRIYSAELLKVQGWRPRWLDHMVARGFFPAPHRDPGGRRRWWLVSEVAAANRLLAEQGTRDPVSKPALTGSALRKAGLPALQQKGVSGSDAGNHTGPGSETVGKTSTTSRTSKRSPGSGGSKGASRANRKQAQRP